MSYVNAALRYRSLGLAPIPVGPEKSALVRWKTFQKRLPTEGEVLGWWEQWAGAWVALVCGWRGLAILDIDDRLLASRVADDEWVRHNVPLIGTPSGGLHLYAQEERASRSGPLLPAVADLKSVACY